LAELGRITSRDISKLKTIWKNAIPKIFMMAKNEGGQVLVMYLNHKGSDDISDGKSIGVKYIPDLCTHFSIQIVLSHHDVVPSLARHSDICGHKSHHHFYTGTKFLFYVDISYSCLLSQEFADINMEAQDLTCPQPVVMVRGSVEQPREAFLVCEKTILSQVPGEDVALVLFATYYAFNMQYPCGCSNVFAFLEVLFLNSTPPPKRTKLYHILNMFGKVL